ncbi:hypothetical protein VA596_08520 [Amycolatopsis sp., V23-08]|uniref:Uncharacterized protein n=1 Tax=Amycolatopsis heterodermiae TaxID=3110235 RepID=A0ABU5R0A2_9PSEU|nr:hypothetical protein [Amycolatopsis sp., V23-08]MEA5359576.1 hypothetical protein [Amycolatopsis sp., V23-08]
MKIISHRELDEDFAAIAELLPLPHHRRLTTEDLVPPTPPAFRPRMR